MNRNLIIAMLCSIAVIIAMSGVAAAEKNKIEILSPAGGETFEYGGPVTVKFVNPYPNTISLVEIRSKYGQSGGYMSQTKKPARGVQEVVFQTGNNVLTPNTYFVTITAMRKGHVLEKKAGGNFEINVIPLIVTPITVIPVYFNGETIRRFDIENPSSQSVSIDAISLFCKGKCLELTGEEKWFTQEPYDPPNMFYQLQHLKYPVMTPGEKRTITLRWKTNEQAANSAEITLINLQLQVSGFKYQHILNLPLPATN